MKTTSWMVCLTLCAVPPLANAASTARALDAFLESPLSLEVPAPTRPIAKLATVAHREPRLGVPTFVWGASPGAATAGVLGNLEGLRPEVAARRHLFEHAELYRLRAQDVGAARVKSVHDTGFGGIIVSFDQAVEELPVFRGRVSVLMNRKRELVAISGHLSPLALAQKNWPERFALTAQTAAALAFQDLTGAAADPASFALKEGGQGGYSLYELHRSVSERLLLAPLIPLRLKPVLFELAEGLVPAFYVEVKAGDRRRTDSLYFSYVVSAVDGRVLFRRDFTHDAAYSYRVWADSGPSYLPLDGPQGNDPSPHPTGTPNGYQAPFVAPALVSLEHAGLSTNDPWLAPGATATRGNNVDAYADLNSPDGFGTGDLRADLSGAGSFDYLYDVTLPPGATDAQRKASVVQIFYLNNFFHDWFYDVGFDEAAGNAQTDNFGRGGLGNDLLLAEGQDYSGRDNANMQAPPDGANPVMQMYVFSGVGTRDLVVNSPAAVAGRKYFGQADFGPTAFDVTADLVLFNDGVSPSTDACQDPVNASALSGKIAFIDRGTCTFQEKVTRAQTAGAIGAIIANNVNGGPMPLYGSDPGISIPALSVSLNTANALRPHLNAGTAVNVRMYSTAGVDRDGTQDNAIMAHEWGHYISNRLIGDSNGLSNGQGNAMGEGWGDFHSMLMVVKASDGQLSQYPNWSGVYGLASYTSSGDGNNGYYFGIRRVPYSTNMGKDPLTFKHVQDGVALPGGVPVAFGANGANNSEVHAAGEVWATMLWECYAALLQASSRLSFDEAQHRMKSYLVASYKLTPDAPTFLEGRDALLAAAFAADPADFTAFSQAFAKRGAGVGALGPERSSLDNVGVVESFVSGGELQFVEASLAEGAGSCDGDGVLDNTETGQLTITLKNAGATALSATTATVSSDNPGLTFANGGQVSFAASQPFGIISATLEVSVSGMVGAPLVPITLSFTDPGLAKAGPRTATYLTRFNYDDAPQASRVDDVESPSTQWTLAHDPRYDNTAPFRRIEQASGSRWFGPNPTTAEDQSLISPLLVASATEPLVLTFRHRYSFEVAEGSFWDGGMVEVRKAGGSWVDVGPKLNPPYPGKIASGQTYNGRFFASSNPLRGRDAFVGKSPGYPAYATTTLDLGTAYAGQTLQVRFRIGADNAAGAVGWDLDDLSFSGITNKPFHRVVAAHLACGNAPPVADAGPDLPVNEKTQVTLTSLSTDPDQDPLDFQWTQTAGPAVTLQGRESASATFMAPSVSELVELSFELVVSDGLATSAPAAVKVLVHNVNGRPVAHAGMDEVVDEGAEVMLSGMGSSDPDEEALSFQWSQVDGPEVELQGAGGPAPTFVAPEVDQETSLTFSLVVSDGALSSEPALVTFTVQDLFKRTRPGEQPDAPGCGCSGSGAHSLLSLAALVAAAGLARRRRRMA